ncbi:MAG: DUF3662 domain-containing protein [Anaerolineae bacterium]|nr:DUF3662 domain-containing protein [Anaerolineae bacterium]
MNHNCFSQLEDRIRYFVEGSIVQDMPQQLHLQKLVLQLAKSMEEHSFHSQDGQMFVPNIYGVRLNPQDHDTLLDEQPDISTTLSVKLLELARVVGVSFTSPPEVSLQVDDALWPLQVEVNAWHVADHMGSTQSMRLHQIQQAEQCPVPDAVLVLNGQHIHIEQPVTNLGRHRDNHIIIDDPTVSRHHAQLRLRFGQYVLFDVSSKSGTSVNGCPIQEATLCSGDVVGLGNTNLIYIANDLVDG